MKTEKLLEQLRQLSDADLRAKIGELEAERFNLRFRGATETLEDPLRLRIIRRDIARVHTILRERAIASAGAASAPVRARAGAGR